MDEAERMAEFIYEKIYSPKPIIERWRSILRLREAILKKRSEIIEPDLLDREILKELSEINTPQNQKRKEFIDNMNA